MWSPRELVGQEAVSNERDQMGIVLLKKVQILCGIPPFYHYHRVLEGICLPLSQHWDASVWCQVFFFFSCSFVGHQQITLTK